MLLFFMFFKCYCNCWHGGVAVVVGAVAVAVFPTAVTIVAVVGGHGCGCEWCCCLHVLIYKGFTLLATYFTVCL